MSNKQRTLRLHPLPERIQQTSGQTAAAVVSWAEGWPPPRRVIVAFNPRSAGVGWCQSIDESNDTDIRAGKLAGMVVYVRKFMASKGSTRTAYYQPEEAE